MQPVDAMTEVEFEATPEQIEMMEDPAHVKIWALGRAFGKTTSAGILLSKICLEYPGCTVWYISSRYSNSLKVMRIMRRCPAFMELIKANPMQFPPRFEFKNGSEMCFISSDNEEELRGARLRLAFLDEAAIQSKNLFYNILMPMVGDSGGTIIAASTFNGRNWFYDLAAEGMPATEQAKKIATGSDPDCKTWIYPSSYSYAYRGSPEKLANYERMKKRTPPMTWQQEYECEPLAQIDAVFQYVDQCLTSEVPGGGPKPGHRYVCSQDIGRIVDRSGLVVMDLDTGVIEHCENYPLGMLHKDQAERTRTIADFWNTALICLDTTGGGAGGGENESAIEEYSKVLRNFRAVTFTLDTKRNMVNRLALDLETKRVIIPKMFKELISQLKLYRYQYTERAMLPTYFGRPDDLVAALMMATWARAQKWGPELGGRPIRFG